MLVQAVVVEPQDAPVVHRDDEQPPVGQEAEPGRAFGHLGDDLRRTAGRKPQHAVVVHVGEPQRAVVPAHALGERQAVDDHL